MEKNKTRRLILILLTAIIFLSSCISGTAYTNDATMPDQSEAVSGDIGEKSDDGVLPPEVKYEKIRFGQTQNILLLDVEWHTPESYEQEILNRYEDIIDNEEAVAMIMESHSGEIEKMKNGELYIAKTVNGIGRGFDSANPYNNDPNWNKSDASQIDPDGYYVFNIYPFKWNIEWESEYGYYNVDTFNIASEEDFYLSKDEVISFCDAMLAQGIMSQGASDFYDIESPLEYYVKNFGWFGEEDLKNYPLKQPEFPPVPEPITDKTELSVLFIGNSLTYSGIMPTQVEKLAAMYGVSVKADLVAPGGALLSDTKDQAIQKMQENQYDYVIMHDGGSIPVENPERFLGNVALMCEEARKAGAIPVLFNPAWANVGKKPFRSYQLLLTLSYKKAAALNGAILVNAAEAWVYAYDKHPDLSLYADDVHANNAGAYLTACVFVSTLFGMHVKDICENNSAYRRDEDNAIRLGQAAWEYVTYYGENKKSPAQAVTVPDGTNEKTG